MMHDARNDQAPAGVKPYPALELAGRDVYIRARAATTAIRRWCAPFRDETERYGHYSMAGESVYDRPFQWGSKRTGPDLPASAAAIRTTGTACT